MKSKIFKRLLLYFLVSFLFFSMIIGFSFTKIFSEYNMRFHKEEMQKSGENIAKHLGEISDRETNTETAADHNQGQRQGQGLGQNQGQGMGRRLNSNLQSMLSLIEESSSYSIWVVDRELNQLTLGQNQIGINYDDLPDNGDQIIKESFNGQTVFSENFSAFLEHPTITLATPIKTQDQKIIGSVLLHSQISDITALTKSGLLILVASMGTGILLSIVIAGILSAHFTKPLERIKETAIAISDGDYNTKTNVRQNDEIGELAVIVDETALKLEEASKASEKLENIRREFIANISHELRTPVTVLRGSLEAIVDGVITDEKKVHQYHVEMLHECKYLQTLVSDLLDLGRLQSADFPMEMNKVDLRLITEETKRTLQRIASEKDIKINLEIIGENFDFMGDYVRLRQMIIILLDNAIKFSYPKSTVDMVLKGGNSKSLTIIDYGSGIDEELLPHIFDRFYKQRDESNKKGSGLGLAIAKQIALRHHIKIDAESKKGKTVFTVVFS